MYEILTEEEIKFMELWYDPVACIENLIPENIKACHTWSEDEEVKCVTVRNYQFAMLNYSYLYRDDKKKSPKQNFDIKRVAGTVYNIAARDIGKSFCIFLDVFLTGIHEVGDESLLASCDDQKLKKVSEVILGMFRSHPFFNIFKKVGKIEGIKSSPSPQIDTQTGHIIYGRNEKIDDPDPGNQFHGIHAKTTWYEEFSYATKKGSEKRVDSTTRYGTIERYSGIPDMRVGSPLGELLSDPRNKKFICRLPQYVREDWNKKTQEEKARKYGGKYSHSYKLNVEAEVLEGAYGKWDMQRIRKRCLITDRKIKYFELNKELFRDTENLSENDCKKLIWERLANNLIITRLPCKQIIISSDIGTTGSPSEVAIYFYLNDIWKYEYQISLFQMTTKEQAYIFDWLYRILGGAFIALDHSNADGRAISERLIKEYKIPSEQVSDFWMQKNIEVGFVVNEKGKVVFGPNNKPLIKEEYTKEWAIQQLENIFYNLSIEIPYDEKFLNQFGSHFEKRGPTGRPSWGSSTDEHLVDTFLLFALCAWNNFLKVSYNTLLSKKRCLGIV